MLITSQLQDCRTEQPLSQRLKIVLSVFVEYIMVYYKEERMICFEILVMKANILIAQHTLNQSERLAKTSVFR